MGPLAGFETEAGIGAAGNAEDSGVDGAGLRSEAAGAAGWPRRPEWPR